MYRLQLTENDCGPVALCNAYEYSTKHKTPHHKKHRGLYREMLRKCEPNDEYGTYPWALSKVGRSVIPRMKRLTFKKERIMNEFNAFILLYAFSDSQAHYVFCTKSDTDEKDEDTTFNVYNHYDPEEDTYSHIRINKEDFKTYFLKSCYHPKGMDYPQAWEVKVV